MEEIGRRLSEGYQVQGNGLGASTSTAEHNMPWISTELDMKVHSIRKGGADVDKNYLGYMLLHPLQYFPLVQMTYIQIAIFLYLFSGQKPVWTNSIVERHHNDIIVRGRYQAACIEVRVRVLVEPTALNVDIYR